MSVTQKLLTEHLDIWTAADTGPKSGRGRSAANAAKVYGVSRLRELILELAVRGKLVPQHAGDEPASELLKKIGLEKARLIAEGQIKKEKQLSPIERAEEVFEVPKGWVWARFQAISEYIQRGKGPQYAESGSVKVISQKCIQWGGFDISQARFVDENSLAAYQDERFLRGNDLLWNSTGTGTVGRICVLNKVNERLVADSHVTVVRTLNVNTNFIWSYIASSSVQRRIEPMHEDSLVSGTTKQVELNTSSVSELPIPVPPLAEQRRIVAKVDELMALCDQLEAEHNNASAAHEKLVNELLATLAQSQSAEDFGVNWQRIAAHFDALFTTEASIDALKQTLLQLAVMGKLVPQDLNDEPASDLIKRIQAEKSKRIAEGGIRRQKELLPDGLQEPPYEVPFGWAWSHMDALFLITGGVTLGRKLSGQALISKPYLRVANVQRGSLELDHIKEIEVPESEVEKYSLKKGDLLITEGGDWDKVGRTAIWNNELSACLHQNHVFRARPLLQEWVSRWSEMYLNSAAAREYFAGSSKQTTNLASINMTQLRGCAFAIPPLAEQRRIVAKVDELMAVCDELKSRLGEASQLQKKLADVLVENTVSAKYQLEREEIDQATARTLLAAEVVHQLHAETRMGQIKLQKVVNLAEYIAGLKEIDSEPLRDVAGPHDRRFMEQVLQGMRSRQWYEEKTVEGGKAHCYLPLAQAGQHRADYEALWSPEQRRKISELIELMRSWKTDQCERVATLYSAWNDLLIEGQAASEAKILNEVLNRWNDSKLNYSEAQWRKELVAMKKHSLLVPTGFGRRTTGGTLTLFSGDGDL